MQKLTVKKNANYTTIANYHLRDERLSWKAKGLLTYLLHLPDGWEVFISDLAKRSKDKIDAVRAILNELEEKTYLIKEFKDENNSRLGYNFIISEQPMNDQNYLSENPISLIGKSNMTLSENPINPLSENPMLINTKIVSTKSKEISPEFSSETSFENLNFSILENHNIRYNILTALLQKGFPTSEDDYAAYVKEFKTTLQLRNDFDKDKFDLRKHFGSWILIQVQKKKNDSTSSGTESPAYKPFIRKVS